MANVFNGKEVQDFDSPQSGRIHTRLELKSGVHALVILLAASLLCLPCLFHGLPAAADAPTHVRYQYHFSRQFWNGESYPRWLADENKGYGSPIFLVQYPLPYFVTALLRPITRFPPANRESRELGVFCFLALAGSGLSAWFWLRKFTRPLAALLAAIVYMSLPYILQGGIYARGSIGELCTFIWMPLALSVCEVMYKKRNAVFVLSAVFALLIVSNLFSAVLFAPVLTAYAIFYGRRDEFSMGKRALWVLLAQLLGVGMASVYLLPLLAYGRMFDGHQFETILPGFQFGLYFLNVTSSDLRSRVLVFLMAGILVLAGAATCYSWRASLGFRTRIFMSLVMFFGAVTLIPNLGPTIVRLSGFDLVPVPYSGMAKMLLTIFGSAALGLLAFCAIGERNAAGRGQLLLYIVAASFFLMLPFSAPIWKAIPGSSVVQFPFRLGGILCLAVTGLVAMAFDADRQNLYVSHRRPPRLIIALATLGIIGGGFLIWRIDRAFHHPTTTAFDATQDVDLMYRAYVPLQRLPAFAKDLGTSPDSYEVAAMPGDGTLRSSSIIGDCDVNVKRETPREISIASDCREQARLQIGQLYSSLWKVVPIQGSRVDSVIAVSADGLIELNLAPGKQEMRLVFGIGAPGRWGAILSETSLLFGLIGFVVFRRRSPMAPSEVPANRE
jgi:hypothetical protein